MALTFRSPGFYLWHSGIAGLVYAALGTVPRASCMLDKALLLVELQPSQEPRDSRRATILSSSVLLAHTPEVRQSVIRAEASNY